MITEQKSHIGLEQHEDSFLCKLTLLRISLPSAELQHLYHSPPLDKAGDPLGSSVRTGGRWEGHNRSQPEGTTGRFDFFLEKKTRTHAIM